MTTAPSGFSACSRSSTARTAREDENKVWWLVLYARARALVERYWPEIEALAIELVERKTLSGEDASEMIRQTINAREGSLLG